MYTGGFQASLTLGPGGDLPQFIGNCVMLHVSLPVLVKSMYLKRFAHFTRFLFLRCAPVWFQSWWVALSVGQYCSPAAGGTMARTLLGNSSIPLPLLPNSDHTTSALHSGAVCQWWWSNQDLRLLCHPAGTVYSAVSSSDPEETAEVFASLVAPLAVSVCCCSTVARDTCPVSLLCNMHWAQLYPFLFIKTFMYTLVLAKVN